MEMINTDIVLDAKGLACPMPIVKTKKAMNHLEPGQVIEVQATDKGSKADLKAWAESSGHQYLGTVEAGNVLKHYLRKASGEENIPKKHPHVMKNEELEQKLSSSEELTVLDVREHAEYVFSHIPKAKSIPLGELENRFHELHSETPIYVVCRTGNRSDLAAQKLANKGFKHVVNVVPGMSEWKGQTEKTVD
ncbi:sulfurtransferase TusA family protein [Aquibacillus albus]|uniref:Rhodanese-related sulfurtransferase/TusA-related sulfurtransferase n=1 Tax=Aquibacillus albus TaxID=1168171 RepID=A0ABS2N1G1_9BACI|nr:sulfurtransferase TusA family protein [Aquibacillus albus]MBM7571898.1 rhodanese-related sulfurtransferase/TusA-related sulfurtransferase [Aquibacillus albus]